MKYKIIIKGRQNAIEASDWCDENIGDWREGQWRCWSDEGRYAYSFMNETDYLCFLLKYKHLEEI